MDTEKRSFKSVRQLFPDNAYKFDSLPHWDTQLVTEEDLREFAKALNVPDSAPEEQSPVGSSSLFITSLNDWKPVYQRVKKNGHRKRRRKRRPGRGVDETREGFVYGVLKWPLLLIVLAWITVLGICYLLTRLYVSFYEHFVTIRGRREALAAKMWAASNYGEWIDAAQQMDRFLGNDSWKVKDEYAYYNDRTIRDVRNKLRKLRTALDGGQFVGDRAATREIAEDLRALVEAAVKDNFVGVENPKLYSETYYGTKALAQSFVDEVELALAALSNTNKLSTEEKADMFRHMQLNYGRTALCLSGGACFAYYHFGVAKALLDTGVLPQVITGTSGGALVAALLGTRTDAELKKLLAPALAYRITACHDDIKTWFTRWLRTGARFDAVDWARRCSWFCFGSLTFKEAYRRTGRILNVTCIPSDPHSPTVLANYLTAPDCVIWSAVLASAAVPGILNPVVLMEKNRNGTISPYAFGHKWKDGSLRTDIPLYALNTHFNVNFPIVSQVNPHINLFFFNSRGTVGDPVTHRRGRGWRGGFLGSAIEQYLKLDLTKWVKVLRYLELLPRYSGTDWSEIYLQRFSGTVTIKPAATWGDFLHILSDPSPGRLARMIHHGQQATFPKIRFIRNRMKIENLVIQGLRASEKKVANGDHSFISEENLQDWSTEIENEAVIDPPLTTENISNGTAPVHQSTAGPFSNSSKRLSEAPTIGSRLTRWISGNSPKTPTSMNGMQNNEDKNEPNEDSQFGLHASARRGSVIVELGRQSRVFFDDTDIGLEQDDSELDPPIPSGSAAESTDEETPMLDSRGPYSRRDIGDEDAILT